ncbi:MAG TPA: tetratricopeptide repeat protein, partial [Candidatus Baltobacteraceae bacterium]|nr:tetratricopeptide repeat protein [Candidatus Baltobacteraceae bacterium]
AESTNWRTALEWSLEARNDTLLGQRLVAALSGELRSLGFATALRWLKAARTSATDGTPATVLARLDLLESRFLTWLGRYAAARGVGERALARYLDLDELLRVAEAKSDLARMLFMLGQNAESERLLQEALSTARTAGARKLAAEALGNLAVASVSRNDVAEARIRLSEGLTLTKASGHTMLEAIFSSNLAEVEFRGGDAAAAVRAAGQSLAAFRRFKASYSALNVVIATSNIAAYLVALGRFDEARGHAREALQLARSIDLDTFVAVALQHLAAIAALRPRDDEVRRHEQRSRAAQLLGYTDMRLGTLVTVREYTEQREYDEAMTSLRDALGAERTQRLIDEGRAWDENRAVAEAALV